MGHTKSNLPRALLFGLATTLVIVGVAVCGWLLIGIDPREYWRWQIWSVGLIPTVVALFVVPFGCYAIIKRFVETEKPFLAPSCGSSITQSAPLPSPEPES